LKRCERNRPCPHTHIYSLLLLNPSSPQTPSTPGSDRDLRRTLQLLGFMAYVKNEAQETKNDQHHRTKKAVLRFSAGPFYGETFQQPLGLGPSCLRVIQAGLAKKVEPPESPSSSSPLPDIRSSCLCLPPKPSIGMRAVECRRVVLPTLLIKLRHWKQGPSCDASFSSEFSYDGIVYLRILMRLWSNSGTNWISFLLWPDSVIAPWRGKPPSSPDAAA